MFLANENFPRPSILFLRTQAFKVESIQEDFPGISDDKLLALAIQKNLIILTFDKDYRELIFRYSPEKSSRDNIFPGERIKSTFCW